MGKKSKVKISENQIKANNYLVALEKGIKDKPFPQCDCCQSVVSEIEDIYEIACCGWCGWCMGWCRLTEVARQFIKNAIAKNKNFVYICENILAHRPNYKKYIKRYTKLNT
jgi:hypothetical protein